MEGPEKQPSGDSASTNPGEPNIPGKERERAPFVLTRIWHDWGRYKDTIHSRPVQHRRRIFVVLAAILSLIGAMSGLVAWLRNVPRPYFVSIWVTEYDNQLLGTVPMVTQDRESTRRGRYFVNMDLDSFEVSERFLIQRVLTNLANYRGGENVVLWLSGYACVRNGEVFLLPSDFSPTDPSTMLSLKSILEALKNCPARHKLLVLDVMAPILDSRLGFVDRDIASRAVEELAKVPDSARMTLLPCSPGQVAHASINLRRTIFGFYTEQGLRGWADAAVPGMRKDGLISVAEWADFVRTHVDRWTFQNMATRQTPMLVTSDEAAAINFLVVALPYGEPQPSLPDRDLVLGLPAPPPPPAPPPSTSSSKDSKGSADSKDSGGNAKGGTSGASSSNAAGGSSGGSNGSGGSGATNGSGGSGTSGGSNASGGSGGSANSGSGGQSGGAGGSSPSSGGNASSGSGGSTAPGGASGSGGSGGASGGGATPAGGAGGSATPGGSGAAGGTGAAGATAATGAAAAGAANEAKLRSALQQALAQSPAGLNPNIVATYPDLDLLLKTAPPGVPPEQILSSVAGSPDDLRYPSWLYAGWQLRDTWYDSGQYRWAPWTFWRLESLLLSTERDWKNGKSAAQAQSDFEEQLVNLQSEFARLSAIPHPQPASLAVAQMLGQQPDPKVTSAVNDFLNKWQDAKQKTPAAQFPATEQTMLNTFAGTVATATPYQLSYAIFQGALNNPAPTPDFIQLLVQMLDVLSTDQEFTETIFLRRLAMTAQTMDPADWPQSVVATAISVMSEGETASAQLDSFDWVVGPLELALQSRHSGNTVLNAYGFAPASLANVLLENSNELFQNIITNQETVSEAKHSLDSALIVLPLYIPYLILNPEPMFEWNSAVDATISVTTTLLDKRTDPNLSDQDRLRLRLEELWPQAAKLSKTLTDLREPFTNTGITQLISQATGVPTVRPEVLGQMNASLRTPFPRSVERIALWNAYVSAGAQLCVQTVRQDKQEMSSGTLAEPLPNYGDLMSNYLRQQRQSSIHLCQMTISSLQMVGYDSNVIAMLKQAGYDPMPIEQLQSLLQQATLNPNDTSATDQMAQQFIAIFNQLLPAAVHMDKSLERADLLSRIMIPFPNDTYLSRASTNPRTRLRSKQAMELWFWLAQVYQYEGQDSSIGTFYFAASRNYSMGRSLPQTPFLQIQATPTPLPPGSSPASGSQQVMFQVQLTLQHPPTKTPTIHVDALTTNNDWLNVKVDTTNLKALEQPSSGTTPFRQVTIPITVSSVPGVVPSPIPSLGMEIFATIDGVTFHQSVPFPTPSPFIVDRVDILLSTDSSSAENPLSGLLLRPLSQPEEYFLWIANPTSTDRELLVELMQGENVLEGGLAKVTLPGNQTVAASFGKGKLPKAGETLPEISEPLGVRVLDASGSNAVLATRVFPVQIAAPQEYTKINSVLFQPISPPQAFKNQFTLSLSASQPIAPPPCVAVLRFPSDRIPGFVAVGQGTMRGIIPPNGNPLQLFAENIRLDVAASLQGYVYVDIDAYKRAYVFQTTFNRYGDASTPQLALAPAVRIDAPALSLAGPTFTLTIETDNAPSQASLLVELGRTVGPGGSPDITSTLSAAKNQQIGFQATGPNGGMLLQASIDDWTTTLNTSSIAGVRQLRVDMLDFQGKTVATAQQQIILDDQPPRDLVFINPPVIVRQGDKFTIQASGIDPLTGIVSANFFLGEPVKNAIPADVKPIPGVASDSTNTLWQAPITVPDTAVGPTPISVQMTNGIGLSAFATTNVIVLAKDAVIAGAISGTVVESTRPQPGLVVSLTSPKGVLLAQATTKPDGTFLFSNVAPGTYALQTFKAVSQRQGTASVTVEAGKTAVVPLTLIMAPNGAAPPAPTPPPAGSTPPSS